MHLLNWLLGLDDVAAIDSVEPALAARWAERAGFWFLLAAAGCMLASVVYYRVFQDRGSLHWRTLLGVLRGSVLGVLLVTLAVPALRLQVREIRDPTIYWIFDGTDSMAIRDNLSASQRAELERAVDFSASESPSGGQPPSRLEYLQQWLRRRQAGTLTELMATGPVRLETFLFDGNSTSRLHRLAAAGGGRPELAAVADQLTTEGQVTALGAMFRDLTQQPGAAELTAVVVFSDFVHNSGPLPLSDELQTRLQSWGVPVHTVGLGPEQALDLALDLQTDPKIKRDQQTLLNVHLRQTGLQRRSVWLTVTARPLDPQDAGAEGDPIFVERREISLDAAEQSMVIPFTPEQSGQWELAATIEPEPGEVISANNRSVRQITVIDDYLRLLYVAYEPTWEWRFIKEVFHRDSLVGINGFRTFLESSDPQVRRNNILFAESLAAEPSEFFRNDVIFLGDVPGSALTPRFGEMVRHFVGRLGGGLVVIAGPRFGPSELVDTPLASMLPVYLEPRGQLRDGEEFPLRLTPHALQFGFMDLQGGDPSEAPWERLGKLPWYQPVAAVHPQALVLAEHPSEFCPDGRTPQPLIAIRAYGKGEVVYLGFNELWRLRRGVGQRYYRRFWSQLIYRLGMSHAVGDEKRFVLRTDRRQYGAGDQMTVTVEGYDQDYEPLSAQGLAAEGLRAEIVPAAGLGVEAGQAVLLPLVREGLFEAEIPVPAAGRYRIRVSDPVTGSVRQETIRVSDVSAERQSGVRNLGLQQEIARVTGGDVYDLTSADELAGRLDLQPSVRRATRVRPLWNTPLWFILVAALLMGEWLGRRMIDLR